MGRAYKLSGSLHGAGGLGVARGVSTRREHDRVIGITRPDLSTFLQQPIGHLPEYGFALPDRRKVVVLFDQSR